MSENQSVLDPPPIAREDPVSRRGVAGLGGAGSSATGMPEDHVEGPGRVGPLAGGRCSPCSPGLREGGTRPGGGAYGDPRGLRRRVVPSNRLPDRAVGLRIGARFPARPDSHRGGSTSAAWNLRCGARCEARTRSSRRCCADFAGDASAGGAPDPAGSRRWPTRHWRSCRRCSTGCTRRRDGHRSRRSACSRRCC